VALPSLTLGTRQDNSSSRRLQPLELRFYFMLALSGNPGKGISMTPASLTLADRQDNSS
jgi:hypothetical protein